MKLTEEQVKQIVRKEVLKHLKEAELAQQIKRWNKLPVQFFRKVIKSIEWETSEEAEKDREFTYAVADINKILEKQGPRGFLNLWISVDDESPSAYLNSEAKDIILQGLYPNTPRSKANDLVIKLLMHKPEVFRDDLINAMEEVTKRSSVESGLSTPEYISPEFIEEIIKEEVVKYLKENE